MKKNLSSLIRAALAAGVLASAACPAAGIAATAQLDQTVTKTYQTTFVKDYGPSVPITGGVLKLTLTKEGYINGYFTPPGTATFIPVVGGRNGADLWFDIGNNNRATHVTGSLQGSEIVGYAMESNGSQYRFTAVPLAGPG